MSVAGLKSKYARRALQILRISIEASAADRERLVTVVADCNSRQKHVWRARIILATAEGCGTAEIMRRAGVSKPCVWRWEERFIREGWRFRFGFDHGPGPAIADRRIAGLRALGRVLRFGVDGSSRPRRTVPAWLSRAPGSRDPKAPPHRIMDRCYRSPPTGRASWLAKR
jgi:hypothetical protein